MDLAALIPARDEAGRVGATVRALRGLPDVGRVLVVDDGSRDGTAREAAEAGAVVVRGARPAGKAEAVRLGVGLLGEPLILLCDADLGWSARACAPLVLPVRYGHAGMTVGCLPPSGIRGGFGAAVGLARWGLRRLTGLELAAPLSGQRVLWRRVLAGLGPARGFGLEVALTADACRAGYPLLELPVGCCHRVTGRDWNGCVHRAAQLRDIAAALACRWPAPWDPPGRPCRSGAG